jgi:hypothetical protein
LRNTSEERIPYGGDDGQRATETSRFLTSYKAADIAAPFSVLVLRGTLPSHLRTKLDDVLSLGLLTSNENF